MKQRHLIQALTDAGPEFRKLDWLEEVVLHGPALHEDPVEDDVDLLLVAHRTPSHEEVREATGRLREVLEDRVQQSLELRITTSHALETPRSRAVGNGRIFRHRTISVFRRSE